jgi:hypothetical protein
MSVTISIRVDEEVKAQIEEWGYSPGEYVKQLLEKEIRRRRNSQALEWLSKNRLPSEGKSSTQIIREARDSR